LVADSDVYLCELLRYALTREGYRVELTQTGLEALQMAGRELPDVAIVDVDLPDVSGLHVCAQLHRKLAVPVLLLSASHLEEERVAGYAHGAVGYITKPFSVHVLIQRMHTVLRHV
jgi:DNA-binding response OmpR family regulator